ncbi:MAG: DUF3568 domain-containing protein [Candidatus Omnitrophica bacterium]|nr:DUF3568 domain-containing protein [Candidatus Omnitrophota bacterium]
MKKTILLFLTLLCPFSSAGCALLLIGAGAAGGYAISKDSVKNTYDLPFDRVYRASLTVVKQMGHVTLEDDKRGVIKGNVNDANVMVTVKQLTPKTVELKVKARNVMPKIEIAQDVYNRINSRL